MANLVCWASGLLEVLANKDTPEDNGPIVLLNGTASRMQSVMVAHGERRVYDERAGWYVPGTRPIPKGDDAAQAQHDNMTLVIEFNRKILPRALKRRLIK